MRVLVLGHKGMLGRAVYKYLQTQPAVTILTLETRWGEEGFKDEILDKKPNFIINAIGKIPQKQPASLAEYSSINIELPRFLDTLGIKTILPSTDCEFSGELSPAQAYTKSHARDATDPYGQSKALISAELEQTGVNTKIIRTSIIGHEENTAVALLDWFLSQTESVRGYTNHYWNGITTLEWAKQCHTILKNWDDFPTLTQLGTEKHYSKWEILDLAKEVYDKNIEIIPYTTETTANKCLLSDMAVLELRSQLLELKAFFAK
jgi:dTDP-4-dehydrorhamnose reductase